MIKQVSIRTSCWRQFFEAQARALATKDPADIAEAWRLFCEASRFQDKMSDAERYVSYELENT